MYSRIKSQRTVAICMLSGNAPTIDGGGTLGMLSGGSTVAICILLSSTGGEIASD